MHISTIPTVAIQTDTTEPLNPKGEVAVALARIHDPDDTTALEQYVRKYFYDIPILTEIARCESRFHQYNPRTGNVLRGRVNSSDVGIMQINEYYHGKTAKKLGFDLHTVEGNLAYARYLFTREGVRPWNASRACWGAHHLALK